MQYSAQCSRAMQYSTPCSREGISRVPPWVSSMLDAPLDDPRGVHSWLCPHCSATRTGFNSKKSAASSKNRHIREKHKQCGTALAVRRKQRDARAHQDTRVHFRVQGAVLVSKPTPTQARLQSMTSSCCARSGGT